MRNQLLALELVEGEFGQHNAVALSLYGAVLRGRNGQPHGGGRPRSCAGIAERDVVDAPIPIETANGLSCDGPLDISDHVVD